MTSRRPEPEPGSAPGGPAGDPAPGAASPAALVRQFHARFRLPAATSPVLPVPAGLADDRLALLLEEVREYDEATHARDLEGIADALADIVYVCYGTALSLGLDLDGVLAAVHRSNMAKAGRDGRHALGAYGKVAKPAGWQPPDVAAAAGLPAETKTP